MGVNGIYGLSGSGLDIESMVKVGMMSKQNEYNKMQQKLTTQTWTKEAFNTVYADLATYNYSTLSQYKMQSTMNAMGATSSNTSAVTVSANGAAAAMTHTVNVTSMASNAYLLTGDEKISRAADTPDQKSSSIYLSDVIDVSDWGDEDALSFTIGDGTNQATVKLTKADIVDNRQTLYDLASAISNAKTTSGEALNLTASYDATNDAFSIYNKTGGESNKITISVNDEKSMALINSLNMQQVNQSATADGVTSSLGTKMAFGSTTYAAAAQDLSDKQAAYDSAKAAYDAAKATLDELTANKDYEYSTLAGTWAEDYPKSGRDSYQRPDWIPKAVEAYGITPDWSGGAASQWFHDGEDPGHVPQIKAAADAKLNAVDEDGKTFFDKLADAQSAYDAANAAYTTAQSNLNAAQETYDNELASVLGSGSAMSVSGTSGTVTIDGKNYTTDNNRVTASNVTYTVTGLGSSTVNVTQDTDAIIEKVKSFVEDYNKLLDGLYEKYSETKYSDYKPLTDAQKDQMSEEQIEKWEKKAKSGMLYHDQTIGKILDKMRTALATPVEGLSGKYNSAYSLGIDTSKTNGHIKLDEDKLKKALAAEPESVYAVFGTLPQADSKGNYDYNSMGVAQRLGDVMVASMKEVKTYAGESAEMADGSTLGNLMQELQTKMSNFKTMMAAFESKLYKKYDALEVALSQLGTQLNYITGGQ